MEAIQEAIATLRGRPFGSPPYVAILDGEAMADTVMRLRMEDDSLRILRIRAVVDRAFGDPWTLDPAGAMRRLPTNAAFGIYSPSDDTLFLSRARLQSSLAIDLRDFLRDGQALAELVITHELAHAWQHWHFSSLFAPTDDIDRWETQHALLEGDAEVTTLALTRHAVDAHAVDEYVRFRRRMATVAGQQPDTNRDWQLRYDLTTRHLCNVVRERSWKGLNAFLDDPPRATATLFEPNLVLQDDADDPLACATGWDLAVDTAIGAFQIPPLLKMSKALLAAGGWRNDRLQICVRGEDFQWRWVTRWDSDDAATNFFDAARAHFQRQHPGATQAAANRIDLSPVQWLERRDRIVQMADSSVSASVLHSSVVAEGSDR